MKSLQETVRRECEERFELTEALSEARETLLKNHLIINGSINRKEQNGHKLPELNHVRLPDHVMNDATHHDLIDNLPPKAPIGSHRRLSVSKEPTPPPVPQPESRDNSSSYRSFTRKSSSQSRASISSSNSVQSLSSQDRTMAVYKASKVQNKQNANSSSGATNDFKSMLNLAMRRGSSQ